MGSLLEMLENSAQALIRERKAKIQQEFMVARRWVNGAYSGMDPSDMPVDVSRCIHDLEIHRDQQVADVVYEVQESVGISKRVLEETYGARPEAVGQSPRPKRSFPTKTKGTPKASRLFEAQDMQRIVQAMVDSAAGVTLVGITKSFGFTTAPSHLAAKRFLVWMKKKGYAKTDGPSGKGRRYVRTLQTDELLEQLAQGQKPRGCE